MNAISKSIKITAVFLFFTLCAEIVIPTVLSARMDIGRNQQEHGGSPNPASELVDPFTGQFRYSIPVVDLPGPNGSGYSMSLNYTSGVKPDDEASWVGLGWELSPGAINRQVRGVPDDVRPFDDKGPINYSQSGRKKGYKYISNNKVEDNVTYGGNMLLSGEIFDTRIMGNLNLGVRYNNYRGYSINIGGGIGFNLSDGLRMNAGFSYEPRTRTSFSLGIAPNIGVSPYSRSFLQNQLAKGLSLGYTIFHEPRSVSPVGNGYTSSTSSYLIGTNYLNSTYNLGKSEDYMLTTTKVKYNKSDEDNDVAGYLYPETYFSETLYKYEVKGSPAVSITFPVQSQVDIMDYSVEKQKAIIYSGDYESQLPIPYSAPDLFSVNASGLSGVFRAYQNKIVQYSPKYVRSEGDISSISGQVQLSEENAEVGGSAGVTMGSHVNALNSFNKEDLQRAGYKPDRIEQDNRTAISDVPHTSVFRFINDKGGEISTGNGDIDNNFVNWNRGITGNTLIKPFINKGSGRLDSFRIVGNGGMMYCFGQPIFSKKEVRENIGLHALPSSKYSVSNNRMLYATNDDISNVKNSDSYPFYNGTNVTYSTPVATSFLLTTILTPDYIDIDNNGVSPNDVGGYTKFSYHKATNKDRKPASVKWRTPYKGYYYSKGNLTDLRDDYASVQFGEREEFYLDSIETKTHIAYFITNKSRGSVHWDIKLIPYNPTPRYDCLGAQEDEKIAGKINDHRNKPAYSEYLDHIRIYAKDSSGTPSKLLKTIRFEYDWSLMVGTPNSETNKGKLTLKKLWFEYNGIANATITPYEFSYSYPRQQPTPGYTNMPGFANLPVRYKALYDEYNTTFNENPNYNVDQIDCWGNYDKGAAERYNVFMTWKNQKANSTDYDPAAWNLKCITLPTGGQIHVQYEEHDYAYVQDRRAMAFCSVNFVNGNEFSLNLDDLNIPTEYKVQYLGMLRKQFIEMGEKIRFRFRFDLNSGMFDLGITDKPDGEDILNGYCKVQSVDLKENKIVITLDGSSSKLLPEKAAKDFRASHNLDIGNPTIGSKEDAILAGLKPDWAVKHMLLKLGEIERLKLLSVPILTGTNQSFLRVPTLRKRGGGIRVKRILNYNPNDNNYDDNNQMLYGTEYIYKTLDKDNTLISSGVATNEPMVCREENALVRLVDDTVGKYDKHVVAGDMLIQCEGPLGEELLPAPSIGYSKVTVLNINPNMSVGGFTVNEYYTVNSDSCQSVSITEKYKYIDYPSIYDVLESVTGVIGFGIQILDVGVTGRYSFTVRNRHGLLKSTARYRGNTKRESIASTFADLPDAVSSIQYEYWKDGEPVPVFYDFNRPFRLEYPGKETERVKEHTRTQDRTITVSPEASVGAMSSEEPDFSFGVAASASFQFIETAITNTMTRNPTYLKSITSYQDGITHRTENIAFDPVSGEATVTRTSDSYDGASRVEFLPAVTNVKHDGSYYTFTVPPTSLFNQLGQKSESEYVEIFTGRDDPAFGKTKIGINNIDQPSSLSLIVSYETPTNESKGKLQQILNLITLGDVITIRDNIGISKNLRVKTIASNFSSATATLGVSIEGGSSTEAISAIESMKITRSYRQNQLGGSAQTVTVYGADKEVKGSVDYARILFDRQEFVNRLNAHVFNGHEFESYLKDENMLTWRPINGQPYDIVDVAPSINCIGTPVTLIPCLTSTGLTKVGHVIESKLISSGTEKKVSVKMLWRTPVSFGQLCDEAEVIVPQSVSNTGKLSVELPYTGSELFHVNDNGELIYGSYLNAHTSERSSSLPWDFRGATCTCTTSTTPFTYNNPPHGPIAKIPAFQDGLKQKVISASAVVMKKYLPSSFNYDLEGSVRPSSVATDIDFVEGRLREQNAFSFRSNIKPSNDPTTGDRNFKAGVISNNFALFDFTTGASNLNWIGGGLVEQYSLSGVPLQTVDPLGIRSSVRTGFTGKLVACEGVNTNADEMFFQSFERTGIQLKFDPNSQAILDTTISHTGKRSLKIGSGKSATLSTFCKVPFSKNYFVRYWAKSQTSGCFLMLKQNSGTDMALNPTKVLQSGDWVLYEANLGILDNAEGLRFSFVNSSGGDWNVDDIKFQPSDASVTSYVYEQSTLRPIAVFNDNHTANLNQYDMEGKLIRSIAETKIGNYTLSEVTSNIGRKVTRTPLYGYPGSNNGSQMKQGGGENNSVEESTDKRERTLRRNNLLQPNRPSNPMDIFQIDISTDKQKVKVFGTDIDSARKTLEYIKEGVKQYNIPKKDTSLLKVSPSVPLSKMLKKDTSGVFQGVRSLHRDANGVRDSVKRVIQSSDSIRNIQQLKKSK